MPKTGATKKPATPAVAKPKSAATTAKPKPAATTAKPMTASTMVKPAAAKPASAKPAAVKPAAVKPAPSKAKPAAPVAQAAVEPKAKPTAKPASTSQPVAKAAAPAPKPDAPGMNGHGGKADKAKHVLELKEKVKKPKLVRDSFTMPELEYQALGDVKKACLKAGIAVKKSELLRVGVALVKQLDLAKLKAALAALAPLKAGRPKKEK